MANRAHMPGQSGVKPDVPTGEQSPERIPIEAGSKSEPLLSEPNDNLNNQDQSAEDQNIVDLAIERALEGVRAEVASGPEAPADAEAAVQSQNNMTADGNAEVVPELEEQPASIAEPAGRSEAENMPSSEQAPSQPLARLAQPMSLEELRAISTSGGQSMDQMIGDVLRPMVREWLNDNLPSLAERLVREEIEKVSRSRR